MQDIRQLVAYIAPRARFSGRRAFTVALACYMEHFAAVEEDDEGQVTKELYPPVARELKKKPRTAQRAIYRAVECIWEEGKNEALNRVIDFLFDEAGAVRIAARHDPRNPGSGAVMRKCGMTCEGTLRQADRNNQGICDACIYSILAEERRKHPSG